MIRRQLAALPEGSLVIHSAARGADTIADEEADKLRLTIISVKARWKVTDETPPWVGLVMVVLGRGGRRDGNDDTSL